MERAKLMFVRKLSVSRAGLGEVLDQVPLGYMTLRAVKKVFICVKNGAVAG